MGERETTWFAGVCWNQALAAARCQDWKHCFQFHAMSSELYASLPETAENLGKIRTSLLLCVAALLAIDSSTDHASESLKVASAYMEKCRKVCFTICFTPAVPHIVLVISFILQCIFFWIAGSWFPFEQVRYSHVRII
jgi:hypothetical protein